MEPDASVEIEMILNLLIGEGVVAYQRGLARAVGCHSAGLMLSQFWYWTQRLPEGRDGWFHKTMPEIEYETVMGRREQDTARRKLRDLGLLEEKKQGQPAKLWFRLIRAAVVELLRKDVRERTQQSTSQHIMQSDFQVGGKRQTRLAESAKLECTKAPSKVGGKRQTINKEENTTKSTAKNTAATKSMGEDQGLFAVAEAKDQEDQKELGTSPKPVNQELVGRLLGVGVGKVVAQQLAANFPEECERQLAYLPFVKEIKSTKGAFLRSAIEQGFSPPKAWEEEQERKKQQEARDVRKQAAASQALGETERKAQIESRRRAIEEQDPNQWFDLISRAEALLPVVVRARPQSPMYQAALHAKVDELIQAGAKG